MSEFKTDIANSLEVLRARISEWRANGERVAFVPTMGALHDGHLSLVRLAQKHADRVVTSIFVNPTQFAPHEDLATYPRTDEADLAKLAATKCDLAYMPSPEIMYPEGHQTVVDVPSMGKLLEGQFRPHFFGGVCTVVSRLFVHTMPDVAVFGEKDFQQLCIIKRMTADFGFPIEIIGAPTAREKTGLAMSSRNAYLSDKWWRRGSAIFAMLHRARMRIEAGVPVSDALAEAHTSLRKTGFEKIDYIAACDPSSLQAVADGPIAKGQEIRLFVAAWADTTRLIDNIACRRPA